MEIAIYTFCVMYSPGPVNLLALHGGLAGGGRRLFGYCIGVGLAMLTGFCVLGVAGAAVVRDWLLPWLAAIGGTYILYLAYRLFTADVQIATAHAMPLGFRQGYGLQLLNPKGLVVILPVTGVMFPAADIRGIDLLICASLISLGAVGAPALYAAGGALVGTRLTSPRLVNAFNKTMAVLLAGVALSIFYDFFIHGVTAART